MKRKTVSITDVALAARVSASTVSRCLNGSSQVSEETRERISRIAEDMGFSYSKPYGYGEYSNTVGIILPDNYASFNINLYHNMLLNNLRFTLEKDKYDLLVSFKENHFHNSNNVVSIARKRKVDGFIFLQYSLDTEVHNVLKETGIPFVFSHYPPGQQTQHENVIYVNHRVGGKLMAEHFIERGYTRIIIASSFARTSEYNQRINGFIDTFTSSGLEIDEKNILRGDFSYESGVMLVEENLNLFKKVRAVFAMNDVMAYGIIRALKNKGLRIPQDIAVAGYDDTELSYMSDPSITTIHQPKEEIARLTCERLLYLIEMKKQNKRVPNQLISVEPGIVLRDST
ncbi:LacI family DNA-binding transcriptional regulator [Marispirochaeta sp.]|uniref:LacI family DNA-binding transcriptional regulator n=1 Tax=Marispirochaeta sp. TaxID=2038653 RepID=UPI0029C68161|nr:LacI family DNA-binding transcriptional regulator [Marispirochaeta sp.]